VKTKKGFEDLQLLKIISLILEFPIGRNKACAFPLHWTLSDLFVYHFHDGETNKDVSCQKKKNQRACVIFQILFLKVSYLKVDEPI